MVKDRVTVTIDRELKKKIDEARGDISRSRFIEKKLWEVVLPKAEDVYLEISKRD